MEEAEIEPWLFRVEPLEGESLSHFLGQFRRANNLTPIGLGKMAGLGGAIARWEKFRFNLSPSGQQLEVLAVVVGVEDRINSSTLILEPQFQPYDHFQNPMVLTAQAGNEGDDTKLLDWFVLIKRLL